MPQDMIELPVVERSSEVGRKACLEVNLHPISFLRKWVSDLTVRECQGNPLYFSDGKLDSSRFYKTVLFCSVSFLYFRSEYEEE